MFTLNEDLSIYATRGDIVFFTVSAEDNGKPYKFQAGDVVRIKVFGKKNTEDVVLQKDFPVIDITEKVEIFLTKEDMKIGDVISKPKDYWYEVVLNDDTVPQTIIGYDDDGAKVFKLFPEGDDIPPYEPKPEDIPVVDDKLDMTSTRPVQNQAVARAFANLEEGYERTHAAVAENFITPEMYGAIGDGEADDTDALIGVMSHNGKVVLNGSYRITERVMCSCSEIEGNNSTIITDFTDTDIEDAIRFVDVADVKITNLTIDGNNGNMRNGLLVSGADNVFLDNITVCDVNDLNSTTNSSMIALYDCANVSATQINIHNCRKLGDGNIDGGGGALYGLYSTGYDRLALENSYFGEIHNINASGDYILEDAAAIYVRATNKLATTLIKNVVGINTGKRFIKSQNAGIVKIDGINFVNACNDFLVGVATMWSADKNQTEPGTTTITNSYIENNNGDNTVTSFLIGANDNVIVSDCVLKAKSGSVLIFTKDANIKSDFIKFANCEIIGSVVYSYTDIYNIAFDNCRIKTSCLVYISNPENNGEFMKFNGCYIEYCDDYYGGYGTYIYGVGDLILNNCDWVDRSAQTMVVKYCNKLLISNCRITLNKTKYPFYVSNDVEMYNTTIINEGVNNGDGRRFMQINEAPDAHVRIRNIADVNMQYVVFGNAHYHIGENVNIGMLTTYPGSIEECVPSYNGNIGAYNVYNIGDGALYIDTNDGKLYRLNKTKAAWEVVGG